MVEVVDTTGNMLVDLERASFAKKMNVDEAVVSFLRCRGEKQSIPYIKQSI